MPGATRHRARGEAGRVVPGHGAGRPGGTAGRLRRRTSRRAVSNAEIEVPGTGRMWQTVAVTFGRIIIGWRVDT